MTRHQLRLQMAIHPPRSIKLRSLPRLTLLGKLRRLMLWLLVVYVSVPFIVKLCPSIQAKLVFLNFGELVRMGGEEALIPGPFVCL